LLWRERLVRHLRSDPRVDRLQLVVPLAVVER
jgi:hypothetical protein